MIKVGGEWGDCRKLKILYSMLCQLCPEDKETKYIGETSKNLYSRVGKHFLFKKAKKPDLESESHSTGLGPHSGNVSECVGNVFIYRVKFPA